MGARSSFLADPLYEWYEKIPFISFDGFWGRVLELRPKPFLKLGVAGLLQPQAMSSALHFFSPKRLSLLVHVSSLFCFRAHDHRWQLFRMPSIKGSFLVSLVLSSFDRKVDTSTSTWMCPAPFIGILNTALTRDFSLWFNCSCRYWKRVKVGDGDVCALEYVQQKSGAETGRKNNNKSDWFNCKIHPARNWPLPFCWAVEPLLSVKIEIRRFRSCLCSARDQTYAIASSIARSPAWLMSLELSASDIEPDPPY